MKKILFFILIVAFICVAVFYIFYKKAIYTPFEVTDFWNKIEQDNKLSDATDEIKQMSFCGYQEGVYKKIDDLLGNQKNLDTANGNIKTSLFLHAVKSVKDADNKNFSSMNTYLDVLTYFISKCSTENPCLFFYVSLESFWIFTQNIMKNWQQMPAHDARKIFVSLYLLDRKIVSHQGNIQNTSHAYEDLLFLIRANMILCNWRINDNNSQPANFKDPYNLQKKLFSERKSNYWIIKSVGKNQIDDNYTINKHIPLPLKAQFGAKDFVLSSKTLLSSSKFWDAKQYKDDFFDVRLMDRGNSISLSCQSLK